ncbi:MAG: PKD domain-containing protein [Brumimicrobium sp.]|nr:PKD domain-containing protein [Brumimicrobium sp.]
MRLFLLILLILLPVELFASHIVGGEIYYDCLGNNNYKITIKVYRDCNSTGAAYDSPLLLGVFNKSNNSLVRVEQINYPGSVILPVIFSNPCVTPPSGICVEEAIYSKTINLPPLPDGYILAYERCCRGTDVINLYDSGEQGLSLTTEIPGTNSGITCNSSPRFTNYPPLLLCNNEPLYFDHSATDPDGDSLVYELGSPYHAGTSVDPMPNPPVNPPFNTVTWESGFNANQPFGASGQITINPQTGQMIVDPDLIGKFVVGVVVKEYRNGVLIGKTLRDFLFIVFNCQVSVVANIVPQDQLTNYVDACEGLTIQFENNSYGGQNYQWDFGVPSDPTASSTMKTPTYTFPGEGDYYVTLVVNPGWPCSDTSVQLFSVYQSFDVFFDPPDTQCITTNNYNFFGQGNYNPGSSFQWEFGNHASQNTSITEDVLNIVYDTIGEFPVTFTAQWKDCINSHTEIVKVVGIPTINFISESDTSCSNIPIQFIDSSTANVDINYDWDFGDGTHSSIQNPLHFYSNPGEYYPTLHISVVKGCSADLTYTAPNPIVIHPIPTAAFNVSPTQTSIFDNEIYFSDQSIGSLEHFYQLTETVDTADRFVSYFYNESGYHTPYQVVTNEFNCTDTAYRTIYIEPQTTLYVPTAFTPDGNKFNEEFKPIVFDVTDYTFTIYNRWGEVVFETHDIQAGWDGTCKGKDSPDGVYVWRIHFMNHKELYELHHGTVALLR